jgi:hypothetical protein
MSVKPKGRLVVQTVGLTGRDEFTEWEYEVDSSLQILKVTGEMNGEAVMRSYPLHSVAWFGWGEV